MLNLFYRSIIAMHYIPVDIPRMVLSMYLNEGGDSIEIEFTIKLASHYHAAYNGG